MIRTTFVIILFCASFAFGPVETRQGNPFSIRRRNSSSENRICECKINDGKNYLHLTYNSSTSILAVLNKTEQTAIVFDSNKHLVAVFCLKQNTLSIINLEERSGIFSNGSRVKNLEETIEHLSSLQSIYEEYKSNGTSFSISSPSQDISKQLQQILRSLNGDECSSISDLVRLGSHLSSALSNLSRVLPSLCTPISGGYQKVIARLTFLGQSNIAEFLISRNIQLNFGIILFEPRGGRVLIYLLQQDSLGEILSNSLNSSESLFLVLNKLEGESSHGLGGLFHVIVEIVLLIHNKGSIQNVTYALVHYYGYSRTNNHVSLGQSWSSTVQELLNELQHSRYGNFSVLIKLLEDIQSERWTENRINLSYIIVILISSQDSNSLYPMFRVLISIRQTVPVNISSVQLFAQYVYLLNSTQGSDILSNLFPELINIGIQAGLSFAELFGNFPEMFLCFAHLFEKGAELGLSISISFWEMIPIFGNPIMTTFNRIALSLLHSTFGSFFESEAARPIVHEIIEFFRKMVASYLRQNPQATEGAFPVPNFSKMICGPNGFLAGFLNSTNIPFPLPGLNGLNFTNTIPGILNFTNYIPGLSNFTNNIPGVSNFTNNFPGLSNFTNIFSGSNPANAFADAYSENRKNLHPHEIKSKGKHDHHGHKH